MGEKKYECNSCGYLLRMDIEKNRTAVCPNCRSRMTEADFETPSEEERHECEECGAVFHVPAGSLSPYKCPLCNHTIPDTPDRKVPHKL